MESLLNAKISTVAGGEAHSGAVDVHGAVAGASASWDDSGSLYMWGTGAYGRLGLGEVVNLPLPRKISMPDEARVSRLALGSFHSVALAGNRVQAVYTWGAWAPEVTGAGPEAMEKRLATRWVVASPPRRPWCSWTARPRCCRSRRAPATLWCLGVGRFRMA